MTAAIKIYALIPLLLVLQFIAGCNHPKNKSATEGEKLAITHCGSCHALPEPALLDKNTWRQDIMPVMGRKLGLDYIYELPLKDTQKQSLSIQDFKKIAEWYYTNAPDTMGRQNRYPIHEVTNMFAAKKVQVADRQYPATSYIKIDPGNHWIYAANAFDSSMTIYDSQLNLVSKYLVKGTLIDINFDNTLQQKGNRQGILTLIGMMNPNDLKTGTVHSFTISAKGSFTSINRLFDSLPRPVQTISGDIDMNGQTDYVVCGFGNTTGALYWIKEQNGIIEKQILKELPGAIKAYIDDFNRDGRPDIIVLMAQAREAVFIFFNLGNGNFDTREVLSFPTINGSSYFELIDFNNDGFKDILYTCGDNADYTGNVLKNYHGLYIFLNDGNNRFTQKYFFPLYGCYKAIARDFDKDGDPDIAAISYFPDIKKQPQESFVYLEQIKSFQFRPSVIKEFNEGRWLTMDAGDADGDGDEDIVLGSLIPPYKEQQEKWKEASVQKAALLLLENKHHQ